MVDMNNDASPAGARAQVAVIMRSMNEQPHTEPTLKGLMAQSYADFTLYNVDSGSTDGTMEVVQEYNEDAECIVQIAPEDYVPGVVLNDMIGRTREPITVFLNADAIPQDEFWLEKLIQPILDDQADATMSRQLPRDEAPFIVKNDFYRGYNPKSIKSDEVFFSAVACAFRRSLWEETRFYTTGYSEDMAWATACKKKGARFAYVHESAVEHSHNFTIKGLYKKRFRHGVAYVFIHDAKPSLLKQSYACLRELARDGLYALRTGRIDTIPYNIVYRTTIHMGYYFGEREGIRRYKKSTPGEQA
jgi:rhamnosyltransferase